MLSVYDYIVIVFYFIFIIALGIVFKKFNKNSKDYFAGGQRMCWWLLGGSLFIANFSCWTFTGAAGIARKYGLLIMYIYVMDVLGYIIGYVFFATRLRQMRLITAIDGVRRRFGKVSEQFFNWLGIIRSPMGAGAWLWSLSLLLTSVFLPADVSPEFRSNSLNIIICGTGIVVTIMALLGGNWAVAASDFIQLLLLFTVTVVTAVLSLIKIGGVGAFIDQLPQDFSQIVYPLGEIKYDWLFLLATIISSVLLRNNIVTAAKYISAKDSDHARKSTLIPMIGYALLPLLWFIPVWAGYTLTPDLAGQFKGVANPEEISYIAVAMKVLPAGLLGLMVVGLFAATMSSMDTAFNKNAGYIVCNFYRDILRPNASDKELLLAGQLATVFSGVVVTIFALVLANFGKISIFDSYLYFAAFMGPGGGVAFLLGMFIKKTPPWSAWATAIFGMTLSILLYVVLRTDAAAAYLTPLLEGSVWGSIYAYILKNPFFMTGAIVMPLSVLFFLFTKRFYNPAKTPNYVKEVDKLFVDMNTKVDFNKEIGKENDNSAQQAKTMGILATIYGAFILLLVLIPNPISGRIAIVFCALVVGGIGLGLWAYGVKSAPEPEMSNNKQ